MDRRGNTRLLASLFRVESVQRDQIADFVYTGSVTAALRDAYEGMSFDGDPYKFAEALYRLVVGADEGKKTLLFLPIGKDALEQLQDKLRMNKVLADTAAPCRRGQ